MDRYASRITLHGNTQRKRELNRFKENLLKTAPASLSYKNVEINGLESSLIVDSNDSNKYIKEIKSMPGKSFETGDYIRWANATWLVIDADYDDEVYTDGKMQQCNWNLTYQKPNGEIVQYWCIDENSTQYNSGETSNKNMILGSSQHMLKVQCNDDTVLIDTPQRLFLDKNSVNPTSFKVTQNDTTMYNYGKGLCCITLTQDEKKTDKDKLIELDSGEKVWIADYIEPTTLPPVPDGNQSEVLCRIEHSGKPRVIIGSNYKKFSAVFYDTEGNIVSDQLASWKVTADDMTEQYVHTIINNDNSIQIKVDYNDALAGKYLKLDVVDTKNVCFSSIFVEIGGAI